MRLDKQPNMLMRTFGVESLENVVPVNEQVDIDFTAVTDQSLTEQLDTMLLVSSSLRYEERRGDTDFRRAFTNWFDEQDYEVNGEIYSVATRLELVRPVVCLPSSYAYIQTRKSPEWGALVDDELIRQHSIAWIPNNSQRQPNPDIKLDTENITPDHPEWSEVAHTVGVVLCSLLVVESV